MKEFVKHPIDLAHKILDKINGEPWPDYPDFGNGFDVRVYFSNKQMKSVLDHRSNLSYAQGLIMGHVMTQSFNKPKNLTFIHGAGI